MDYIYAKAANGLTVRIPADKYPKWKKAQDELRRSGKVTKEMREMARQLQSIIKEEVDSASQKPISDSKIKCHKCGREQADDRSNCYYCGAPFTSAVIQPKTSVNEEKLAKEENAELQKKIFKLTNQLKEANKKKHGATVLAVAACVVFAFLFILLLLTNQSKYNTGYNEGYDAAYDIAYGEGYDTGFDVGYDEGYDKGYDIGIDKGYDSGYVQAEKDAQSASSSSTSTIRERAEKLNGTTSSTTTSTSSSSQKNTAAISYTVYVSKSGGKIHKTPNCSGMKNYYTMSYSDAIASGYTKCKNCY